MTTATFTNVFDSTTDAGFRSWGSAISGALQTCGLVQTTDTGQINWTTVTSPTAATAGERFPTASYEIYKFNDSLQSTKPIFIKLQYGTWALNAVAVAGGLPVIRVSVGTGTNGAGILTGLTTSGTIRLLGNTSSTAVTSGTPAAPTTSIPCYFSGDGSYISVGLGITTTGPYAFAVSASSTINAAFPAAFIVDRTRDTSGAITSNGAVHAVSAWLPSALASAITSTLSTTYFSFTTTATAAFTTALPIAFPGTGFSTASVGSTLYTFPFVVATPDPQPQMLSLLGVYGSDIAPASSVTINVLGSNHTYLSLAGCASGARSNLVLRPTVGSLMIRYE